MNCFFNSWDVVVCGGVWWCVYDDFLTFCFCLVFFFSFFLKISKKFTDFYFTKFLWTFNLVDTSPTVNFDIYNFDFPGVSFQIIFKIIFAKVQENNNHKKSLICLVYNRTLHLHPPYRSIYIHSIIFNKQLLLSPPFNLNLPQT